MPLPIDFVLESAVIYITTDPTKNRLVLQFLNQSGSSMTLKGGTPVPEQSIRPTDPTSFYLSFGRLLTPAQFSGLSIAAEGWVAEYFGGASPNWALCPRENVTLANGQRVAFVITHLLADSPARPGQLDIDYYNVPGTADSVIQREVLVQNPPDVPGELPLTYDFADGNTVYTTRDPADPIANTLYFTITNPTPNPLVKSWSSTPVLNISFLCADPPGYGALTTALLAADIDIAAVQGSGWNVTKNTQDAVPFWQLTPTADNQTLFDANAVLELEISNIITPLPVGAVPEATNLYIQASNFPGYNDAASARLITRLAGPKISAFYPEPFNIVDGQPAPCTLYWETDDCSGVRITGFSSSFLPSGQVPTTRTLQPITLTAEANPVDQGVAARDDSQAGVANRPSIGKIPEVKKILDTVSANRWTGTIGIAHPIVVVVPGAGRVCVFSSSGDVTTRFAVVNTVTNAISLHDLATAIPNFTRAMVLCAVASRDGNKVYVAVLAYSGGAKPQNHVLILAVTAADASVALATDLGYLGDLLDPCGLTATPDGNKLYFTFSGLALQIPPLPHKVGGLCVIDTADFRVPKRYDWPRELMGDNRSPAPLVAICGTSPDGAKAILAGYSLLGGFVVLDVTAGCRVVSAFQTILAPARFASAQFVPVELAGSRLFAVVVEGNTLAMQAFDVDWASGVITSAGTFPLPNKLQPQARIAFAIEPDGRYLYVSSAADQITLFEATSFKKVATLVSGINGDYAPMVMRADPARPGVVYASPGGTWTTLTVTPWPF